MPYANNKGAEQPDQRFCFRCLDSIIRLVSISEISSLYLSPIAEQTGLSVTLSKAPKTGFLMTRLICFNQTTENNIKRIKTSV